MAIITLKQAIEVWDAGEPLAVFEVETEGTDQSILWGIAIEELRCATDLRKAPDRPHLSKRENEVVDSIVQVALRGPDQNWQTMIRRHVHEKSPAIEIRKPKAPEAA